MFLAKMNKKTLGSRRTTAPKPDLERLIEISNLIPPDFEMKNVLELIGEQDVLISPWFGTPQAIERKKRMRDALIDYMGELPQAFREYLWGMFYEDKNVDELSEAELEVIGDRLVDTYQQLKYFGTTLRKLVRQSKNPHPNATGQPFPLDELIVGRICIKDGKFKKTHDFLSDTIDGVETERLRECERCKRIFWARRKNGRGCSKRCATVLRQRNFYNKHYKKGG